MLEQYKDKIMELLDGDCENIELVSQTSNIVFKAETQKYGRVYIKIYLHHSSHIDHELYIYSLLEKEYLKELIISSEDPKIAIFKELKGKTLDELSLEELKEYKEKIIESVIHFYESIGKCKAKGYGILDEKRQGTSSIFLDFIQKRQLDTQNNLQGYNLLDDAFTRIIMRYKDLLLSDNSLVPIDTNAKNIMVTEQGEIKFIDPGELISGPILMGYGDFAAHIYKTELYECLINKLSLSKDDEIRLHIYAVFSSLNILAFLKKMGVTDLKSVIPFGNKYSFYKLIEEHLQAIDINPVCKIKKRKEE